MAKFKQKMTLAQTKNLASNVLHISLKPENKLDYIPGQFITLHFEKQDDSKEIRRSYSIANPPNTSDYIEFAISYQPQGIASEAIFHMNIGDEVEVSGPAGRLILQDEHPKRYVLVATGTGVTPYRAMLNQIENISKKYNTKFLLLFGVRNTDECLYHDEFVKFTKYNENFQFEVYYSRELPQVMHDYQHKGYVQTGFDNYNLDPETDMIYLCGNPGMIDAAYEILLAKGFTARTVRREKYISSK